VARLFILVEGETEETFVNELLAPHLYEKGFECVSARLMGNARLRVQRGGVRGWTEVKTEVHPERAYFFQVTPQQSATSRIF